MIERMCEIGNMHRLSNGENQDALGSEEGKLNKVIALADGVSACSRAREGAEIASSSITNLLYKRGMNLLDYPDKVIARLILSHVKHDLQKAADLTERPVEDYSSTISSVLYDGESNKLLYYNLGDGMILYTSDGDCRMLSGPSDSLNGCCVTTTENAEKMVSAGVIDSGCVDSVIIFSDGAWHSFYRNNSLDPEVSRMIVEGDYEGLREYLKTYNGDDDCSFISMTDLM